MKKYDSVIFDVDGTLLDTSGGVLAAVEYTINKFQLPPLSDEQLRSFIGPPIQNSFIKHYGVDEAKAQEIADVFRDSYKNDHLLNAVPYDGIYEVFETLEKAGMKLAVATYKRQDYAVEILKHFHFDQYTDILYGADNQNKLKKKDIIQKCMDDMHITDHHRAVMVGDSANDAIGADDLGMNFIGVTYGFDFRTDKDVNQFPNIGTAHTPLEIIKLCE